MSWTFVPVNGPYGGTTEGPVWDGECLLFTHIPDSTILKFDPKTGISTTYLQGTNFANGLSFDTSGRLYACEGGARRVVRYDGEEVVVLVDRFEGKKLNIPNDLVIDREGNIWFTDPYYEGAAGDWSLNLDNKELTHDSVYRINLDGQTTNIERVTFDTTRPNGLLFSLDYKTLFVAQSGRLPEEKRELRAYPVNPDGSLAKYEILHDFGDHRGVDGMVLDCEGNIVACAGYNEGGPGPKIYVFSPSGEIIETHTTPFDRPTNCTFGGKELTTLYVTTGQGYLLMAHTERKGRLNYPA